MPVLSLPSLCFEKGTLYTKLGMVSDEALDAFEMVIRLDSNYAQAHYEKALILRDRYFNEERINDYKEALIAFNNAIQLNPNNPQTYFEKGIILYSNLQYEEALNAFDKAVELQPDNIIYYQEKGNTLFNLKRYDEAIVAFSKSFDIKYRWNTSLFVKLFKAHFLSRIIFLITSIYLVAFIFIFDLFSIIAYSLKFIMLFYILLIVLCLLYISFMFIIIPNKIKILTFLFKIEIVSFLKKNIFRKARKEIR